MATKKVDPDLSALKAAHKALLKSSSKRMLRANLDFLVDCFLVHPSKNLPEHLKKDK